MTKPNFKNFKNQSNFKNQTSKSNL